jgi:hypothetical protein
VLLLVLILVLIAFGLLVVALLSGSVLWAWVSVAVSVAAAVVLVVDWMQRRAAVRAGAGTTDADAAPSDAPSGASPALGEPAVEPATEVLPAVRPGDGRPGDGRPGDGRPAAAGPPPGDRRDEREGVQETVVLRSVAPPGSTRGPSSAVDGNGPHPHDPSHSVTSGGVERPGGDAGRPPAGDPRGPAGDAGRTSGSPDPDAEATVKVSGSAPGAGAGAAAGAAGAVAGAAGAAAGPPPGSGGSRPDLPPLGPDGAPPEEPRDADAATLVAELDDEVLVVDELPRYHLAGCRSLANRSVIPLPAREAVELGFTPCAWCTPDRALSNRHPAAARGGVARPRYPGSTGTDPAITGEPPEETRPVPFDRAGE